MESVQKKWSPEGQLDTPYQRARQEWDDRIGSARVQANWLDAYDLLTNNASNMLNTYAQQNNPIKRALEERVGVEIISMVPMSRDTWQVDWKESQWDTKGNQIAEVLWRGMFRIVIRI